MLTQPIPNHTDLLEQVNLFRLEAVRRLDPRRRSELGQFMTPAGVAHMMSSMIESDAPFVSLLDAGAGVGSLIGASVAALCQRPYPPRAIQVTAYEIDGVLIGYLRETLQLCQTVCQQVGIDFSYEIIEADFIVHVVDQLANPLFTPQSTYTCAIINPPYRKIHTDSVHRRCLRQVGIETSNLYTGFLALAMRLLAPEAELIAITPRSFCNGHYFRPFRELLLETMALRRVHLFESRDTAFGDDEVLQENIILSATKADAPPATITITSSTSADEELIATHEVAYEQVVHPGDAERFIHLVTDIADQHIAATMAALGATLSELGLTVSTGRVVDFRAAAYLRQAPADETVPLIYPTHIQDAGIAWPKLGGKKPNALALCAATQDLCVPNEHYVLIKRFSAKEERRRVTAALYEPHIAPTRVVGFENHLNYIHRNGRGLDVVVARGLTAFLNSTLVDRFFRQFNGHTQVNATDLRTMRYPTYGQLMVLGARVGAETATQDELDALIREVIMTEEDSSSEHSLGI